MIGLKHNQNLLVDYDPEWPFLFEEERDRLESVLLSISRAIEHYGSTAVPGHYIIGRGRDLSERTHLVHIVEFNGQSWRFNLAFRVALMTNRNLREEYLAAKQVASRLAPEGRAKYNELKQAFFDRVKIEYLEKLEKSG